MSLKSLVNDPDFKSLSSQDQKNAVFNVEPEASKLSDQEFNVLLSSLAQKEEIATQASQFLQKPENILPLSPIPLIKGTLETGKSYLASEKNYPTENLLPAVGASIGGMVTSPTVLGTLAGTQLGGMGGSYLKNIVSGVRGNLENVPENIGEASSEAIKEGGKMVAAHVITSSALKGLEALSSSKLARAGYGKLIQYVNKIFEPTKSVSQDTLKSMRDEFEQKPVIDSIRDETADKIKNLLAKRGVGTQSFKTYLPEGADKNFKQYIESGQMTKEDVSAILRARPDLQSDVKDIGREIQKTYQEPGIPANQYKPLQYVESALRKPDMKHGEIFNLKQYVDDQANFLKNDANREGIDKIYGHVYDLLNKFSDENAKELGFLEAHMLLKKEGQKYFSRLFLKDLFEQSKDFSDPNEPVDYGKVLSKLSNYTGNQLVRKFGKEGVNAIQILRSISGIYAKTFSGLPVSSSINQMGNPYIRLRPESIIKRFNIPEKVDQALLNKLNFPRGSQLGEQFFARFETPKTLVRSAVKAGSEDIGKTKEALRQFLIEGLKNKFNEEK